MFGLYTYFELIEELIKYKNINECFKFVLFVLALIFFPAFIGICLLPGFFVPIVNIFMEEGKELCIVLIYCFSLAKLCSDV
jgi:putative effector of murein hydrolase LrgA (UPF0299 family)